ncbi:hypothetical protein VTK26DRAFT_7978 [Humicola hyalothermophila]
MESARESSQPLTVDLFRADLAEVWPTDHPDSDINSKSPVAAIDDDYLDLERIQTPGPWTSESKKDILADMLAGVLDPTPKRRKELNHGVGACSVSSEAPEAAGAQDVSPHEQSDRSENAQLTEDVAQPTTSHGTRIHKRPSPRTVPKSPEHETTAPPVASGALTTVQRPEPAHEAAARPTAATRVAKRQVVMLGKPSKATSQTSSRIKSNVRKEECDLYSLSSSSDVEAASQAKRRKKQAAAPRASHNASRNILITADRAVVPSNSERRTKKPAGRRVRKPRQVGIAHQEWPEKVSHDGQDHDVEGRASLSGETRLENQTITAAGNFNDETETNLYAPIIPTQSRLMECGVIPAPVPSPTSPTQHEPLQPAVSNQADATVLSSDSSEKRRTEYDPASTSPLIVEPNHGHAAPHNKPDVTMLIKPTVPPALVWPVRGIGGLDQMTLDLSPPSFQPKSLARVPKEEEMKPSRRTAKCIFAPDEPSTSCTNSPSTDASPSPQRDPAKPEDIWRQAVADDSPPEVLHRIVTLLHRSMKPREEVVLDIVNDYRVNAQRLLDNLRVRHCQEKSDTLASIRTASGAAMSIFSDAVSDMQLLSNKLQGMDVTNPAGAIQRPSLSQKLDEVARLCQAKLSSHVVNGTSPALESIRVESASEPGTVNESANNLADTYRVRLSAAVRRPGDQAAEAFDKLSGEADEFIRRCLQGESNKARPEDEKRVTARKSPDEALETFLDSLISTLQGNGAEGECSENRVVDVNTELPFFKSPTMMDSSLSD